MKAVIDTNVFVSAIFWKGVPGRILKAWFDHKFQLVVTPDILEEYLRVLRQFDEPKVHIEVEQIRDALSVHTHLVPSIAFMHRVCTDPDDDKFLAAAISGQASHVVTGDKALLKTSGYQAIEVLKPAAFLKLL